jgi:hypothetical protein
MGEPIKMGKDNCPYCGYEVDMATNMRDDGLPQPHDLSICLNCTGIMEYGDDFALQEFPEVLFNELPEDVQESIKQVQKMIGEVKAKMN